MENIMKTMLDQREERIRDWALRHQIALAGRFQRGRDLLRRAAAKREQGIDGILVTVGLCIIALLLCLVMKDSLSDFIETIVGAMTDKAKEILTGPGSTL